MRGEQSQQSYQDGNRNGQALVTWTARGIPVPYAIAIYDIFTKYKSFFIFEIASSQICYKNSSGIIIIIMMRGSC